METFNRFAWWLWKKIPEKKQEETTNKLISLVIILWVLVAIVGAFATYRLGEYVQAKRYMNNQIYIKT